MSAKAYNIGIAGSGIAGLSAALFLKRAGHTPTLYDQMETPKPIGSGLMLQPTGLAVMERLDLLNAIKSYGQPIERLIGVAGKRPILDVRYDALKGRYSGLAVHRAALFDVLYQAVIAENIPIQTGRAVRSVKNGALVFADGKISGTHDFVIDALGVTSPLKPKQAKPLPYAALWATLDWNAADGFNEEWLEQRYKAARKMIGVLPVGTIPGDPIPKATFFWSLKHTDYAKWQERGLDAWKAEVTALWPETTQLLSQITKPEQLTLARYASQTLSPPYIGKLVHIGDAFHCASPQLGQGANMALLDAYALAEAITQEPSPEMAFHAFHRNRRMHVNLYQLMASAFTPVYQSDGRIIPWLRDHIVPIIARIWPFPKILAAIVAGMIGSPLKTLGLRK